MVIDFIDGLSYAAGYQFKFELLFFFASDQRIIILIKWKCPLVSASDGQDVWTEELAALWTTAL